MVARGDAVHALHSLSGTSAGRASTDNPAALDPLDPLPRSRV